MTEEGSNCPSNNYSDTSGGSKSSGEDSDGVPRIDTELQVLEFLYRFQVPMQPLQIYGGLCHHERISFSYSTLQNKIASLTENGDVKRVKVDNETGELLDIGEEGGRGNYMITESGKNRIESELDY